MVIVPVTVKRRLILGGLGLASVAISWTSITASSVVKREPEVETILVGVCVVLSHYRLVLRTSVGQEAVRFAASLTEPQVLTKPTAAASAWDSYLLTSRVWEDPASVEVRESPLVAPLEPSDELDPPEPESSPSSWSASMRWRLAALLPGQGSCPRCPRC